MDHLRNSDDFELLSTFLAIAFFFKEMFHCASSKFMGHNFTLRVFDFKFMTFYCFAESSYQYSTLVVHFAHVHFMIFYEIRLKCFKL